MSSFSEGQIHQLADDLEATRFTPGHLTKLGQSRVWLEALRDVLDGKAEIVVKVVTEKAKEMKTYLRRLYERQIIKLGQIVFTIYEMVEDGTFSQIFGSLGEDLNQLAFASREQVDEFCRVHRDKLRTGGYATFFLYKEGENFLVAGVYVDDDGGLGVRVYLLECGRVGHAEYRHRVVVPQL